MLGAARPVSSARLLRMRTRPWQRLLAFAFALTVAGRDLAQAGQGGTASAAYAASVDAYMTSGDVAPARNLIASSPRRQIEAAVGSLRASTPARALAASILHLELAIDVVEPAPDDAMWHVRLGEQLIDAAARDGLAAATDSLARWSVVASSVFQVRTDVDRARAALAFGLARRPRDAAVRLHAGIVEDLASLVTENDDSGLADRKSTSARRATYRHMANAERAYRETLTMAPGLAMARIRLGRLLHRRGRFAEARGEFERARAGTLSDTERYLLLLFLSSTYEALDEPALARAALQEAVRAAGTQQGAWLALAQFEERSGQPERARGVIAQGLVHARRADADAWWDYRHGGFDREGLAWLRGVARSRQ